MNFSSPQPGSCQYNKMMMQKHMDQKRTRKENCSMRTQDSTFSTSVNKQNAPQSLQRAGQTLIRNNSFMNSSYVAHSPRPKIIDQQNQKMKRLLRERMKQSLQEQIKKKKNDEQYQKKLKKTMSVENGMLDYLQKQIQKRDNFISSCLVKQQIMKSHFVDDDMRKHKKAVNLIEQNYDVDVFNHQSDRYQEQQRINFQKMLETNHYQAKANRVSKQFQRSQYGKYLDQKYVHQDHNPITNPKPFYIGNPYIRKQINKL